MPTIIGTVFDAIKRGDEEMKRERGRCAFQRESAR